MDSFLSWSEHLVHSYPSQMYIVECRHSYVFRNENVVRVSNHLVLGDVEYIAKGITVLFLSELKEQCAVMLLFTVNSVK